MSLEDIPHRMPIWIYGRGLQIVKAEDCSFWDFDYLATKIEILSNYDIQHRVESFEQ